MFTVLVLSRAHHVSDVIQQVLVGGVLVVLELVLECLVLVALGVQVADSLTDSLEVVVSALLEEVDLLDDTAKLTL